MDVYCNQWTDTDRAHIYLDIYGASTVKVTISSHSGYGARRDLIRFADHNWGLQYGLTTGTFETTYPTSSWPTCMEHNAGLSSWNYPSFSASKIVADSTTIYNSGFVDY